MVISVNGIVVWWKTELMSPQQTFVTTQHGFYRRFFG